MLKTKELKENWFIQSSSKTSSSGVIISQGGFLVNDWYNITVPSTILAGLVSNNVYPDPYQGLNLKNIPGFKENVFQNFDNYSKPSNSPFLCSWWFRKEFELDFVDQNKNYWLFFKGINYCANIWFNGKLIGNKDHIAGTFRQFDLNITPDIKSGLNVVALEIFSPNPDDLAISFVDWNPAPPDDNMGLWQPVLFYQTGPVKVHHTFVKTQLDPSNLQEAFLVINSEFSNISSKAVNAILRIVIDGIILEKSIALQPYESFQCSLDYQEFLELKITNPRIWWPYQLGTPDLYTLRISVEISNLVSDEQTIQFGIRDIKSYLFKGKSRVFLVNGIELLIRGLAWTPDMMLQQSKYRDDIDIDLIKNSNVNTIRMEGKLATDYFWEKCDQEGLMVIAGWVCCGFWEKWDQWKAKDLKIAKGSLQSQLLRLRNHPGFICWLYGSDFPPPEPVEREYMRICNELLLDLPVLSSASDHPSVLNEATGIKMTGPYTYVPPIYWYLDHKGSAERFNLEAGPDVCIPPWESLIKMIPEDGQFIGSESWNFHMGLGAYADMDYIEDAITNRYGVCDSLYDFVKTSQILGYECWRAVFEAYARNFPPASGFIGWMGNSAWPSLIWQLYDYYYNTTGAYYGTQKACEPLHIQYSYDDGSIWFINQTIKDYENLQLQIQVFDFKCNEIYSKLHFYSIKKQTKLKIDKISKNLLKSSVYFLLLRVKTDVVNLSRNFYWLSSLEDKLSDEDGHSTTPVIEHSNQQALRLLPPAQISVSFQVRVISNDSKLTVHLKNNSDTIAFFLRVFVIDIRTKDPIFPVLWNENCISLLPFENYQISGIILNNKGENIDIVVDGWNTN